jgi:hypothetical protein
MESFQAGFASLMIISYGEILWKSPVQDFHHENLISSFMAGQLAKIHDTAGAFTIEEPLDSDWIERQSEMYRNMLNEESFSTELYQEFSHHFIRPQHFLKEVNPNYITTFIKHVACMMTGINELQAYQKRSMLIFTKSSWTQDEIKDLMNPQATISPLETLVIDHFISGMFLIYYFLLMFPRFLSNKNQECLLLGAPKSNLSIFTNFLWFSNKIRQKCLVLGAPKSNLFIFTLFSQVFGNKNQGCLLLSAPKSNL